MGTVVFHISLHTTIHINAMGNEESHTIIRVELVALHTALDIFAPFP
jgi:hypothetical protein